MQINGEVLRAIREAQGWTQTALATEAGLSSQYVNDIEAGRRKGSNPEVVTALAQALKVPKSVILRDTSDRTGAAQ